MYIRYAEVQRARADLQPADCNLPRPLQEGSLSAIQTAFPDSRECFVWKNSHWDLVTEASPQLLDGSLLQIVSKAVSPDSTAIDKLQRELAEMRESLRMSRAMIVSFFGASSTSSKSSTQKRNAQRSLQNRLWRDCKVDRQGDSIRLEFPDAIVPQDYACAAHLFPSSKSAAHLFPSSKSKHLPSWLGLHDENSPANGLILLKCVEVALDAGQIYFDFDSSTDTFSMKILDQSIANTSMQAACAKLLPNCAANLPGDIANTSFGDLEGQTLHFLGNHQPVKRCMNFKARMAVLAAEEQNWVATGSVLVDDYGSDGEYKARLEMFFSRMVEYDEESV